MFSSKAIIFVLALFFAFASARPISRRCPGRGKAAAAVVDAPSSSAPVPAVSSAVANAAPQPSISAPPLSVVKGTTEPPAPQPTAPTTPSNPGGVIGGLLGQLFPVPGFSKSWTTAPASENAIALNDAAFRPTNVLRSVPHTFVNAPDGKRAMKAHYPKGSYTFGHNPQGGFSFYAPGPASLDLKTAREATFGYRVFFPKGFGFQLGGKLPGLYGGNSDSEAVGCSGGRRATSCFSARLMWRSGGDGEFYTYLPHGFDANNKLCNVAPQSDCNPTYGASVGRGSFRFPTGEWTTISERVRLNTPGQADGELQLFVNGKSVINVKGLVLRDSSAGKIRGMQMQTFFGGSKPEFASPKDQDVFFSDFSVAITETF